MVIPMPARPLQNDDRFELVTLKGGAKSIRSAEHGETMHIGSDPVTESACLHVVQQRLAERAGAWENNSPFVVWDIGLGPAANALAAITALRDQVVPVEIHSFEIDMAVLEFALRHAADLGYLRGWEGAVGELLSSGESRPSPMIRWRLHRGDFSQAPHPTPPPSAVLFDPYSPARNPEMWNLATFRRIREASADDIPCLLTNYTRSTSARVTMLLAGWFVGRGVATGGKEETTVAANRIGLLGDPLDATWLKRVASSTNAAPLRGREYVRLPIADDDFARLLAHPQFSGKC